MPERRLIGGFFGLELPASPNGGFSALWNSRRDNSFAFANARSGFAALIDALDPANVWLPAYICRELAAAVPAAKLGFYPVGHDLRPDVRRLAAAARGGDVILGVNYFGSAPPPEFVDFAMTRSDLWFVEDCAQSIDTGTAPWGHWRLYSPRKVIGVPDGGLVVAARPTATARLETTATFDIGVFEAALRRFEDEAETQNAVWHSSNQARESATSVSHAGMSRLSRRLVELLDPAPIIERRRANCAVLQERLGGLAVLHERTPGYVPFGLPIRLAAEWCDALVAALAAEGIFAARHWRDLPSPAEIFVTEHSLARELVTLPCDQRYDADDMSRVAAATEAALS
jgi:dTDP-4-amino-4,6-dideoxygalactose transaminase